MYYFHTISVKIIKIGVIGVEITPPLFYHIPITIYYFNNYEFFFFFFNRLIVMHPPKIIMFMGDYVLTK